MAKRCEVCNKETRTGSNVSHSNKKTKREWKPNIQKVKATINGSPKRVSVCTSCIRSGKVNRAI